MSSTKDKKPATHFFFEEVYEGEEHEITCRKVGSLQNDKGEYEVVYKGLKDFKPFFGALMQNDELAKITAKVTKLENTLQNRDLYVLDSVVMERDGHDDYTLTRLEKEQLFVRSGLLLPGTYAPPMQWIKSKMDGDDDICNAILKRYCTAVMPRYTLDDSIDLQVVDAVGE